MGNRRLLLLVLAFAALGCDRRWSGSGVKDTESRGIKIVAALKQYKSSKGKYPDSLSDLAPTFIPSIEQPLVGDRQWGYKPMGTGDTFDLWVKSRGSEPGDNTREPDFEHMEYNYDYGHFHFHRGF
jgi:hypothetical protein